ncbi:MAG: hypothetical protein EBT06_09000 [Gammaproteobacteria bacterium]|nr:hypothetical protein [Gammaproteobacteria bacterium]NBT45046.1 hypothetical protein [Gammaproteobacteria bacterium]NBY22739.1 hypothetical protein [Gammaproteobacteria bacterium]
MKLGCGTLILLFLMIATLGKWLPHGERNAPPKSPGTPPDLARHAPSASGAKVTPPAVVPSKRLESPAKGDETLAEMMAKATTLLRDVEHWVSESAKKAETISPLPKAMDSPPKPPTAAKPSSAPVTPSAPPIEPAKVSKVAPHPVIAPAVASSKEPNKPPARVAEAGKDLVFNSPWNQSVDQVERYLKHHTHDAASMSILEWGRVEVTEAGYQVRCGFKSRNVLGKWTSQNKLFVLNRSGEVVDVRD